MIVVISGGGGFKGLGQYLLHDEDHADTSERVAWTAAQNIDTGDPEKAVNRMAAVAMSQDALKAAAGIKATGRKIKEPLSHIVMAWHADDRPDRERMEAAAKELLHTLKAEGHQSLIVAHNDKDHAHLHILLNRISPEDGKALSMSYSQKKAQEWALAYEKKNEIRCYAREENAAKRAFGQAVESQKRIPRNVYELDKKFAQEAVSNDNLPPFERYLREQQHADRSLKAEHRQIYQSQRDTLQKLAAEYRTKKDAIWHGRKDELRRRLDEEREKARAGSRQAFFEEAERKRDDLAKSQALREQRLREALPRRQREIRQEHAIKNAAELADIRKQREAIEARQQQKGFKAVLYRFAGQKADRTAANGLDDRQKALNADLDQTQRSFESSHRVDVARQDKQCLEARQRLEEGISRQHDRKEANGWKVKLSDETFERIAQETRADVKRRQTEARDEFFKQRETLFQRQEQDKQRISQDWQQRKADRATTYEAFKVEQKNPQAQGWAEQFSQNHENQSQQRGMKQSM